MNLKAIPVLMLNSSYEAISICSAKRAMTMWAKGKAWVEASYDQEFYHGMKLPSVIRLSRYAKVPKKKHTISRRNIFLRDQNTCQYCKTPFPASKLTLDHIMPKSRGGASSWENLASCCFPCNHRKADMTPEEAGMILAKRPKAMDLAQHRWMLRNMGSEQPTWRKYLYYE